MTTEHIESMATDGDMVKVNKTALTTADLTASGITATRGQEGSSWAVEDSRLAAALSDYGVSDIKSLLDQLLSDTSVKKKVRRRAVGRVVQNQPHKTSDFKEYDKQNQMIKECRDHREIAFGVFTGTSCLVSISAPIFVLLDPSIELSVSIIFGLLMLVPAILFGAISFFVSKEGLSSNKLCYGERSERTIEEFNEWTMENKKKDLEKRKSQLAQLSQEISGEGSTVSVSSVKKEYEEALSRIASYELDFEKALKYPAFNNILVPETQEMVKQMRACKNRIDGINASNVDAVSGLVDELWVKIQVAEETAKSISTSTLSKQELALFETARGLFAHASDPTYSDDVRANYYRKLKSVVDTLNERRTVIPTKMVEQLEAKATQQIEGFKEEVANV